MPEVRNTDREKAWSLKDDDMAIVYMCGTAWRHHTLCDANGTKVYASEAALKKVENCTDECGIVEVEMKIRRWTQRPEDCHIRHRGGPRDKLA